MQSVLFVPSLASRILATSLTTGCLKELHASENKSLAFVWFCLLVGGVVEAGNMTSFGKLADREDGRIMSQNSPLGPLLFISSWWTLPIPSLLGMHLSEKQSQVSVFFVMCLRGLFTLDCSAEYFRVLLLPLSMPSLPANALGRGFPGQVPSGVSCLWKESFW